MVTNTRQVRNRSGDSTGTSYNGDTNSGCLCGTGSYINGMGDDGMKNNALPDADISPLMWVRMDEGLGTIHSATVLAVLPNQINPKERTLLVTTAFPEGITVHGNAEDISFDWLDLIAEPEEEEEYEYEIEADNDEDFYEEECGEAKGSAEFDYQSCGSPCGADDEPHG